MQKIFHNDVQIKGNLTLSGIAPIFQSDNADLDLRAGSSSVGQKNINLGWAFGANLYFWGGTSGATAQTAFSVLENGDGYFNGGITSAATSGANLVNPNSDLDLRAGSSTSGQKNISLGWAFGSNLYFWGGTSGASAQAAFSVLANGNGYFNGELNILGIYKIKGTQIKTSNLLDFPSQANNAGKVLSTNGTTLSWNSASVAWGNITGTLSDQADLVDALSAKASLSGATFTNTVVANNNGANFTNSSYTLDLRAGNGITAQDISLGYGSGFGKDLRFYGGTTSPQFSIVSGEGYFSGAVNAIYGYKVNSVALNFSHLDSHPDTLSGYGITDAYPLTGNPSGFLTSAYLSGYATQSWVSGQGFITNSNPTLYLTNNGVNLVNSSYDLDIRAGNGTTGKSISLGFGVGYGANLYFWGGSATTVKFSVDNTGNGYFLGGLQVNNHPIGFGDLAGTISNSQLNLGTTSAPVTNTATPPSTIYGTGVATLTSPASWLIIHDSAGNTYKVPAY